MKAKTPLRRASILRRRTVSMALAVATAALVFGCGPIPVTTPEPEAAVPAPQPGNALVIARADDAMEQRRLLLLRQGQEPLSAGNVGYYMDVLTARLRQDLAGKPVEIEHRGQAIALTFPGLETFDTGSAQIAPAMGPVLNSLGRVLDEYRASLVTVAGHTDSQGSADHNQRLSEERALSVGRQLLAAGVAPERLVVMGLGDRQPIGSNDTPEGQARNRRVELIIEPLIGT